MKQFVELPNGVVVDTNNIAYILRVQLNQYAIVPKQSVSPNVPSLDGNELEALKKYLDVEKLPYEKPAEVEGEKPLIQRVDTDKGSVRA